MVLNLSYCLWNRKY